MDLDELIAAIAGFTDRQKLIDAMKANADIKRTIYQPIFDAGHGAATAAMTPEKETAERTAKELADQIKQLNADLEKLKKDNPDAAKLHDEYKAEIKRLNEEHEKAVNDIKAKGTTRLKGVALRQLEAALIAKGVKRRIAKAMMKDDDVESRIKVNEDGTIEVLQPGKSIAYAEESEDAALNLLADALFETVDDDDIDSNVRRGTGRQRAADDDDIPAKGKKGKKFYDDIRKDVRGENEKPVLGQAVKDPQTALASRLGGASKSSASLSTRR